MPFVGWARLSGYCLAMSFLSGMDDEVAAERDLARQRRAAEEGATAALQMASAQLAVDIESACKESVDFLRAREYYPRPISITRTVDGIFGTSERHIEVGWGYRLSELCDYWIFFLDANGRLLARRDLFDRKERVWDVGVASNSVVYGSGGRVAADVATVTA